MIYNLSSTTQKNLKKKTKIKTKTKTKPKKKQLPGCYIKVEEISRTFQGVAKKFKDFSRTTPKIQGLLKTVRGYHLCGTKS